MTSDLIGQIMAYESNDLNQEQIVTLFQELVDSGMAWQLQGHYGRTARNLIDAGYVTEPSKTDNTDKKD